MTKYCLDAPHWQPALQEARRLDDEDDALSGLAVTFLDEGCRAIDAASRKTYTVVRAPDEAPIDTSGVSVAARTDDPSASRKASGAPRPSKRRGKAKRKKGRSRASIRSQETLIQGSAGTLEAAAGKKGNRPPRTKTQIGIGALGAEEIEAATRAGQRVEAARAAEDDGPRRRSASPAGPSAGTTPAAADLPPFEIVHERVLAPTEERPFGYAETSLAVVLPVPLAALDALARQALRKARTRIGDDVTSRGVEVAIYDHTFDERPRRPPLVLGSRFDWRDETAQVVFFPYAEGSASSVDEATRALGGDTLSPENKPAPVARNDEGHVRSHEDQSAAEAERKADEAKAAAEAKRKADEAKAAAEAKRKADEAKAAAEAKRKAEKEKKSAEEAKRKADEEKAAAAEAKRKADEEKAAAAEEAKRKAEEEKKSAEEAKRKAEAEAKKAADEAKRNAEEARTSAKTKRKAEEAKKSAEEAKRKAEAKRQAAAASAEEAAHNAREDAREAEEAAKSEALSRAAADAVQARADAGKGGATPSRKGKRGRSRRSIAARRREGEGGADAPRSRETDGASSPAPASSSSSSSGPPGAGRTATSRRTTTSRRASRRPTLASSRASGAAPAADDALLSRSERDERLEAARDRASIIPPPPSMRGTRVKGEDLLTDVFEAVSELFFLADALEGADFVLRLALEKLPSEAGLISLFDIDKRHFVVVRQTGGEHSALLHRLAETHPVARRAMRAPGAVVVSSTADEPDMVDDRWAATGVTPASLLIVPVHKSGRYLGLIELANPYDGKAFRGSDANALTYMGEQFADFLDERGLLIDPDAVLASAEAMQSAGRARK